MSDNQNKLSLSALKPSKGSTKRKIRVGRGIGSGKGKTAGRGHKGQNSRTGGGVPEWFEGGAMPFYRRIPKVGFTSIQKIKGENQYNLVNLNVLERHFNDGDKVDLTTLNAVGYATNSRNKAGIKVLATGELTKKLNISVNKISKAASDKIEAAGGTVEVI